MSTLPKNMVPLLIPSVDVAPIIKWNSPHPLSSAYFYVDSRKYHLSLIPQICDWQMSEMPFWVSLEEVCTLSLRPVAVTRLQGGTVCPGLTRERKKKKVSCITRQHSLFCFQDVVLENLNFPPRQSRQKRNCETASLDKGTAVPRKQMLKRPHVT